MARFCIGPALWGIDKLFNMCYIVSLARGETARYKPGGGEHGKTEEFGYSRSVRERSFARAGDEA
jgi:hypothetical protein